MMAEELRDPNPQVRLRAIHEVQQRSCSPESLEALERIAAADPVPELRVAAREALDAPGVRVTRGARIGRYERQEISLILTEIQRWNRQGLLGEDLYATLSARYRLDGAIEAAQGHGEQASSVQRAPEPVDALPATEAVSPPAPSDAVPSAPSAGADASPESAPPAGEPAMVSPEGGEPSPDGLAPKVPSDREPPAKRHSAAPPTEPQPAPSSGSGGLLEILLSESTIKIVLYLGAFFVIASALILAALVELLRLPILTIAILGFGGVSLALRRRLPQPSFALMVIASFILPINARVIVDMTGIQGALLSGYWTVVWLGLAVLWGGATWLFSSRLFGVVTLASLGLAGALAPGLLVPEPAWTSRFALAQLGNFVGLGAIAVYTRWADAKVGLTPFVVQQIASLGLAIAALVAMSMGFAEPGWWRLAVALAVGLAALSYGCGQLLRPFVLTPWLAAAASMPVGALTLASVVPPDRARTPEWLLNHPSIGAPAGLPLFDVAQPVGAVGWALVLLVLAELSYRLSKIERFNERLRGFDLPLGLVAGALVSAAAIYATSFSDRYGLAVSGGATFLLLVAHLIRARGWLFFPALMTSVLAYFLALHWPFHTGMHPYLPAVFTLPAVLMVLPDLFFRPGWRSHLHHFIPLRLAALLLGGVACLAIVFVGFDDPIQASGCVLAFTVAYGALAVRYNQPWSGFLATAGFALSTVYASIAVAPYLMVHPGYTMVTLLCLAYYGAGEGLDRFFSLPGWSRTLRWSALLLAFPLVVTMLVGQPAFQGFVVVLLAGLFLAESRRIPAIETLTPLLASLGLYLILRDAGIEARFAIFTGVAALWLVLDLLMRVVIAERPLGALTKGGAALLVVWSAIWVVFTRRPDLAVPLCSAGVTALVLPYVLVYRKPLVGYGFTLMLGATTLAVARSFEGLDSAAALLALAFPMYVVGAALTKASKGWGLVLTSSAILLATLSAARGLAWEGAYIAAIPFALAATLWAIEAYRRKNVWLAAPANLLYLVAYLVILVSMRVEEPQLYAIGVAVLGMVMHLLLVRADSKIGAFLTGMLSQLALLGTTYIQMLVMMQILYFAALFVQALVVLCYGLILRSRSLVAVPVIMLILGVSTVVLFLFLLGGLPIVLLIGGTGLFMVIVATLAFALRGRLAMVGQYVSTWRA